MYTATATATQYSFSRALIAICIAFSVTFGLFLFMTKLISKQTPDYIERAPSQQIDVVNTPKMTITNEKNKPLPPKPKNVVPPKQTIPAAMDPNSTITDPFGQLTKVITGPVDISFTNGGIKESSARPLFRVSPSYPAKAAREGVEGWVKLRFSINEMGEVEQVSVIDASPKRMFEKAAIRALRRWKYQPKIENGQAIRQEGQQVQLDFNLDNS